MTEAIIRKYELLADSKLTVLGVDLFRVRALVSFGPVSAGDVGGYVRAEDNLSHAGAAWVSGDAWVYGAARVYGDAQVYGNAWVYGDARVSEPRHCLTVGPLGSRAATLTVCRDSTLSVSYATGCFFGSREAFLAAVEATHGDSPIGNVYAAAVMLADHVVPPYTQE